MAQGVQVRIRMEIRWPQQERHLWVQVIEVVTHARELRVCYYTCIYTGTGAPENFRYRVHESMVYRVL